MQQQRGILYVVATPIGNLADMTERARKILSEVALVAAEDTRETLHLLNHFGIAATLVAYHDHNESRVAPRLLADLEAGRDVALVSDAGTPLINDPGYSLVAAARERGLTVVPVPGANAAICALSAAGLPSDRFLFLGFPPRTSSQRRTWLGEVADEPGTLILYESAKRALATLEDLGAVLGEHRRVVLARELTKRFETFLSGQPRELIARLEADPEQQLGELVILVEGRSLDPDEGERIEQERVLRILGEALPLRQAVDLAARLTGARKNTLYRLGLDLGLGAAGD
ncbi:16S rRNA (cytidine(1402)-2'-O)-methyltransferase [Thiocystis violascens]|uniref:Ribosomal RNA small subunit methyltransferase I n=1 Tax=Thiocystis violascens (strain ATCC 17096 / DSM 198 / 6111) TaxID=765911 RepID=I3YBA7_THIV6|nr:16S rRNA (cytidine(1402)-2'-O)-methyltransferase [Thiocystis violascens]AFL74275.1 putative S-adenosylmethionine-dependent methyltransferase, YraL family [Thiocystis violascens DSM 198]